jgi:hypothetical protein
VAKNQEHRSVPDTKAESRPVLIEAHAAQVTSGVNAVADAIALIKSFDGRVPCQPLVRYEVGLRYSNGNEIRGQFKDKAAAVAFLRGMR